MSAPAAAPRFERVLVVGVGLIGGSFALALKGAGACREAIGLGRSRETLEDARARGILDAIAEGPAAARAADLVLVATPVGAIEATLAALAPHLGPRTLLTDAGSTKRDVVAAARRALGAAAARFVPAHPLAGGEQSGAAAARADLFRGRRVVLTPLEENPPEALAAVEAAWGACGAHLARMSAQAHDEALAAVSHLPHLLAYAFVHEIAARPDAARLFACAAGGFRDFTRIAASHPEMWRDICLANRDLLGVELARYQAALAQARAFLEAGDGAALERLFAEARAARARWLAGASE
ncbi:MAG: prephenate dehydrogenase/arogenate dehydrogenase family protein [Burkholderiales bacterium]|nr:prephenate dehydrogenase/arogenate dehydrogenase family protein [Burkholderiales bacterium]